jgi:3',5'-cyclic-AMP phosphodiesterase
MDSIRLLQFSDPHLLPEADGTIRGVASLPALEAAIADARGRFRDVDAVLLTGDLVQDDPGGYRWIRETFAASPVPVLCLAGNHDLPDHMRTQLRGGPFQVGGAREFGRWLVIMLDTWVADWAGGRIGKAQLAALRATLAQHRNHHVLICLHHQPIPMRSEWLDEFGLQDAQEFNAIVASHPNVRGVLWGHVHQSLDCYVRGVRYMATPATCAQFAPHARDFTLDQRPPGYRTLELMPDGSIASEVIWLESYQQVQPLAVGA